MGKNVLLVAAAPLLLFALPQPATAKPSVVIIQPEGSQTAMMESGSQVIVSQLPGSTVIMRTPEPFEGGRTKIYFTFVNNGQAPVNVGPENISSTQIAVVSYDKLMAEQKSSEGWNKFAEALKVVGNTLSANEAARRPTTTVTSGYVDCGFRCDGTYSSVSQTYDPNAARQARLQAEAQNSAAASAMHANHAAERNAIAANLRTTTVMPGHFITGMLTFEVPKKVRRGKQATPTVLYIRVGSDVHVLKGYAGAIGTTPPPTATANPANPKSVSPILPSNPVLSARDEYTRGAAYYNGQGVGRDLSAAADLFRKAADKGYVNAQFDLGTLYERGEGVPKDFATAMRWYRKAADQGFANAQYNLGHLYHNGQGVPQDFATAASWYRKAADQGLANAQFNLGILYHSGQGVSQDFAIAATLYRRAADQGVPEAQYSLGAMYHSGQGVTQDFAAAAMWYRKAADQGFANAQYNLGVLYADGQGVAQDLSIADNWYRKAAEQGLANAEFQICMSHYYGRGVPRDFVVAASWCSRSANQGLADAQYFLGTMYYQGKGVPQEYSTAASWTRKAADQGHASAQHNLGVMYQKGQGVARDAEVAKSWYQKAANQGLAEAKKSLSFME